MAITKHNFENPKEDLSATLIVHTEKKYPDLDGHTSNFYLDQLTKWYFIDLEPNGETMGFLF